MTKKEIYDELKAVGVKLKAVNTMKLDVLTELYRETFGKEPGADDAGSTVETGDETEKGNENATPGKENAKAGTSGKDDAGSAGSDPAPIPVLHFRSSGWCEALKRSYFKGKYRPKTRREYEALKPYAK